MFDDDFARLLRWHLALLALGSVLGSVILPSFFPGWGG